MKKLRFLLLSLLTMVLFTFTVGCEVAGNSCETVDDCEGTESCFAGYCGQNEPLGSFIVEFNMRTLDGSSMITCEDAGVDNIAIKVSTHGFELKDKAITLPCSKFNIHEIADTATGPVFLNFWRDEQYEVTATFEGTDMVRTFTVSPSGEAAPGEAKDANHVKFKKVSFCATAACDAWETCNETAKSCDLKAGACGVQSDCTGGNEVCTDHVCVAQATLTVNWRLSVSGNDVFECGNTGITEFKLAIDEIEDTDNTYADHTTIPCSAGFTHITTLMAPHNGSINIYGVDASGEKLYFVETTLEVSQSEFDAGASNKMITLNPVSNKK